MGGVRHSITWFYGFGDTLKEASIHINEETSGQYTD